MSLPRFSMPGRDDDNEDEPDVYRTLPSFHFTETSQDQSDGVQDELARMVVQDFTRELTTWVGDRANHTAATWSVTHFGSGRSVITLDLPRMRGMERQVTIRLVVSEHDGVIGPSES